MLPPEQIRQCESIPGFLEFVAEETPLEKALKEHKSELDAVITHHIEALMQVLESNWCYKKGEYCLDIRRHVIEAVSVSEVIDDFDEIQDAMYGLCLSTYGPGYQVVSQSDRLYEALNDKIFEIYCRDKDTELTDEDYEAIAEYCDPSIAELHQLAAPFENRFRAIKARYDHQVDDDSRR